MFPIKQKHVDKHQELLPVRVKQEDQMTSLSASSSFSEVDAGNVTSRPLRELQNTYSGHVPDIRATAARIRPSPVCRVIPDIKRTAANLRFHAPDVTHLPVPVSRRIDIRTIAEDLQWENYENMTFFIPEVKQMARDLRRQGDEIPAEAISGADMNEGSMEEPSDGAESLTGIPSVVEDQISDRASGELELTEPMQISCNPDTRAQVVVEVDQQRCTHCVRSYEQELGRIRQNRRRANCTRRRVVYGRRARLIVTSVYGFFKELRSRLKNTCAGEAFRSPRDLTTTACGISKDTFTRMLRAQDVDNEERRKTPSRKNTIQAAMNNHGPEWGEAIKLAVHHNLREEKDITIRSLHEELSSAYENFTLSKTTLHRLLKALGFSFKINNRQPFIFERADLIAKRRTYLQAIATAREEGNYIVFMDETWIFSGMTKRRGWNDNTIPIFASRATMEKYSCGGRAAGKNKGKRAIVVGAIAEDGVIAECTKVVVSGVRDLSGDYHMDMNSDLFEMWLAEAIPHMLRRANGKRVSLVMDNAPYHSRQLEKIPTTSSTKDQIRDYLSAKGVAVPEKATKVILLKKVKERTMQWMATVPTELAVGWFREARWHESQAREKEALDREEEYLSSSSSIDIDSEYETDDSYILSSDED